LATDRESEKGSHALRDLGGGGKTSGTNGVSTAGRRRYLCRPIKKAIKEKGSGGRGVDSTPAKITKKKRAVTNFGKSTGTNRARGREKRLLSVSDRYTKSIMRRNSIGKTPRGAKHGADPFALIESPKFF